MFENRSQAGILLGKALGDLAAEDPIVFALPRGGLPVAAAVAKALHAPLDIILVRKIGAPGNEELAIGAIVDGSAPTLVIHRDIVTELQVPDDYLQAAKTKALKEIDRRRNLYTGNRSPLSPKGRTVILVDDGIATGATMEVAVKAMRQAGAGKIVVAVPTAPAETALRFQALADHLVCLETPDPFWSVGGQYQSFPQLTDTDVIETLRDFNAAQSHRETQTQH